MMRRVSPGVQNVDEEAISRGFAGPGAPGWPVQDAQSRRTYAASIGGGECARRRLATAGREKISMRCSESVEAPKENPDVEAAAIFGPNGEILERFISRCAKPITRGRTAMAQQNGQFAVSVTALRQRPPSWRRLLRNNREHVGS